jgi:ribosome-associated protein
MGFIDFSKEVYFKTARSGGKGGQNVNKVETMAEARWNVQESAFFSEEEKQRITTKCAGSMNAAGELFIKSQEKRGQLENKAEALKKMLNLVKKALIIPKKRKPTQPTEASKRTRIQTKKKTAEKKDQRK